MEGIKKYRMALKGKSNKAYSINLETDIPGFNGKDQLNLLAPLMDDGGQIHGLDVVSFCRIEETTIELDVARRGRKGAANDAISAEIESAAMG